MTLNPTTCNYDNHNVDESSPQSGTNECWWPGAPITQNPVVVGSEWDVGQNGNGHDQYGLDSIGFNGSDVNYIQSNGPDHDLDFPCTMTIYQEMSYETDANTFVVYVENTLTQTIGSNTVQVCRAGVCTSVLPW
jgi:hypothetical protein